MLVAMSHATPHLCVVGSTNIDLTFRASRLPKPGETLAGHGFQIGHGGKGANQAVMAARLGARVTMISRVGRDVFGEGALANYRAHGVDTTHVGTDPDRPTGAASIVVDDAARNCILVVPGANLALAPDHVCAAAPALQRAELLLCQLEVPVEAVAEAMRLARAAGVRTVLNPAPAAEVTDELLALADLCVPNETEAELLTGQSVTSLAGAAAAGWDLVRRGAKTVIVTLGGEGSLIVDQAGAVHVPPFPVRAVDPTGAGDAFIGALGVFLGRGELLPDAARRASAVAALAVSRPGTQTAFPSRDEVDAFLATASH
jgi:ribokinase